MASPGMSLVIPVFNMERYLPDLLGSLERQEKVQCGVEVIFVDDGSTDDGNAIIAAWLKTSSYACQLITQANGGVSAARNTGLSAASGEWVSFPDADDVLDPHYLLNSWRFLKSELGRQSTVVASRVLRLDERSGRLSDDHPLRFRFETGARAVDMNRCPDYFQLHAASSFFRLDDLTRSGARFPDGVSASEDAMFVIQYLVASPRQVLGLNPAARYLYRRRTQDSTIDRYLAEPERSYLTRFGEHYASLLGSVAARGPVPDWLQSILLYELHWVLAPWQRPHSHRAEVSTELGVSILDALSACSSFLDDRTIMNYDATALSVEIRLVLMALKGSRIPSWVPEQVDCVDTKAGKTRWRRWETGPDSPAPASDTCADGEQIRRIVYFAQTPLREVYEWRAGIVDAILQDRAVVADRARRRFVGQRWLALSSRATDMRVRRARLAWSVASIPALRRFLIEWLRRSVLSRTKLNVAVAGVLAVLSRRSYAILVGEAAALDVPVDPGVHVVRVGAHGGVRADSLRAAVAVRRAARIVSDDAVAALQLLRRTRPRASNWQLVLRPSIDSRTHEWDLVVAEVSARTVG